MMARVLESDLVRKRTLPGFCRASLEVPDDAKIVGGGIPVHGIEARVTHRAVSKINQVTARACGPLLVFQREIHFPVLCKRIRGSQSHHDAIAGSRMPETD